MGGKGHETTPTNSVRPFDMMHNSSTHKPVGTHEFLGEDAAGPAQPSFEIYAAAVACLNWSCEKGSLRFGLKVARPTAVFEFVKDSGKPACLFQEESQLSVADRDRVVSKVIFRR